MSPPAGDRPRARRPTSRTPAALGYRLPAEWEPHRATWLVWPHNRADWEVKSSAIPWVYGEMVRHLTRGERVGLVVQDAAHERRARSVLTRCGVDLDRVELHRLRTNRSWIRDAGPIFVTRPGRTDPLAATDWRFTGWGRYRSFDRDDRLPRRLATRLGVRRFEMRAAGRRVVLEGGSVDVNGEGLLLTTEECLLSPVQARNPDLSRDAIERALGDAFGVERVLWLGRGIVGDDTHGHVDDVARFVDARTVAVATEPDRGDVNHAALTDNRRRLARMTDRRGRPLRVVPIPMPGPLYFDGERLPASYLNFYIGNRVVLVPTFNDPRDRVALSRLARLFPTREVVGVHAVDLVLGLGTIHCLTQQEPRVDPGRSDQDGSSVASGTS